VNNSRGLLLAFQLLHLRDACLPPEDLPVNPSKRFVVALLACTIVMSLWPSEAAAQRRRIRGPVIRSSVLVVGGPAYSRYSDPFFWPYYGPFFSPYAQFPYPPYYPGRYFEPWGSARIQVKPEHTEVYIDGYLVGTADDFDGVFQRLDAPAGQHELTLYLEGFQTFREKVLFRPGATLKISHTMQPLAPGAAAEARPQPPQGAPQQRRGAPPAYLDPRPQSSAYGSLAIRAQPSDATILIDGEAWTGPETQEPLVIELTEGTHRVEVRREGFTPYLTTVRIRRGETVRLNVSLSK